MKDHHGVSRRHVLGMALAAGGFAVSSAVSSVFAQALSIGGQVLHACIACRLGSGERSSAEDKLQDLIRLRA